jgi:hypothetical protein
MKKLDEGTKVHLGVLFLGVLMLVILTLIK